MSFGRGPDLKIKWAPDDPWPLLLAGFALQLAGFALALPTVWVTWGLLAVIGGVAIQALLGLSRLYRSSRPSAVAWLVVFLLLLLPGAYLEFPADPWEHVRRLWAWRHAATIPRAESPLAYSYLLGYSLLGKLPEPLSGRFGLALLSSLWQLLVLVEYYRLVERFGIDRSSRWLHLLAFVAFFGTYGVGWRYYALAALPLAYAAFLRASRALYEWLDDGKSPWSVILATGTLILAVHPEELVLLALAGTAALTAHWATDSRRGKLVLGILGVCWVMSLAVALVLTHLPLPAHFGLDRFQSARLWSYYPHFGHTLGIFGVIGVVSAIALRNVSWRLRLTCLAPVLFLTWPLLQPLFHYRGTPGAATYRFLYGSPWWSCLVLLLQTLVSRAPVALLPVTRNRLVAATIMLCGFVAATPWRGRLAFQFEVPDSTRALHHIDHMARWLLTHRSEKEVGCEWISDSATSTALAAWLGRPDPKLRRSPAHFGATVDSYIDLLQVLRSLPACGVIVARTDRLPAPRAASRVVTHTPHWDPDAATPSTYVKPGFERAAGALLSQGWMKTQVSPAFDVYEPPRHVRWTMIEVDRKGASAEAHLLQFPDGHNVLIDAGDGGASVVAHLRWIGVRWLHDVVLTHASEANLAGLRALMSPSFRIERIVLADGVTLPVSLRRRAFLSGVTVGDARTGQAIHTGHDATLGWTVPDGNLRLSFGNASVLFSRRDPGTGQHSGEETTILKLTTESAENIERLVAQLRAGFLFLVQSHASAHLTAGLKAALQAKGTILYTSASDGTVQVWLFPQRIEVRPGHNSWEVHSFRDLR